MSGPNRLLSVDSENRWVWWKEAAGAFSDRPIGGWGAGSFATIHLLYRHDTLSTTQAHSVPLQFLAETGLIGAALALGAFGLLLAVAVRTARGLPPGRQRLLAAALLAGAATYAVHATYDWDWAIPGVTLPALTFLGVLAGAGARRSGPPASPGLGRGLALAGVTVGICVVAFSGVLPSLAADRASAALVAAAQGTPASLAAAASDARYATSFDPLADQGLLVEASIDTRRGQPGRARSALIAAIEREPTDVNAWEQLSILEQLLGNQRAELGAAQRTLALDPLDPVARVIADRAMVALVPAADSATSVRTP